MSSLEKLGVLFLTAISIALMIGYGLYYVEKTRDTREFVEHQAESDAYSKRYASLSSFDMDAVGKISVQEALELIFTYASDTTPVIVKGPDNQIHIYVTGKPGTYFTSHGKPLGRKINGNGDYYDGPISTNIGAIGLYTELLPSYRDLYNYLSANQRGNVYYYVNIDPDNTRSMELLLFTATN